jgi:hypothetical protein
MKKTAFFFVVSFLFGTHAFAAPCPSAVTAAVQDSIEKSQAFLSLASFAIPANEQPAIQVTCDQHHPFYDPGAGPNGTLRMQFDPQVQPLEASIMTSHEWMHAVMWSQLKKNPNGSFAKFFLAYRPAPGTSQDEQNRGRARWQNRQSAAICFAELIADLLPLYLNHDREILGQAAARFFHRADERSFSKTVDVQNYDGWYVPGTQDLIGQLLLFPIRSRIVDEMNCFDSEPAGRALCLKQTYTRVIEVAAQAINRVNESGLNPVTLNQDFILFFSPQKN